MSGKLVEVDVAQALATALSLTYGTDIKTGPKRSTVEAGNAVVQLWVSSTGGRAPEPYLAAAISGSLRFASVQVLALGPPTNRDAGLALARSVIDALHTKDVTAAASPSYIQCLADSSDPLPIGVDEAGQWMFASNFTLQWVA